MNDALIELHDAQLDFADRTVWSNLNLDVPPGEFLTILGPNGSGKSSLLKVILGINELSSGSVTLFGGPVRRGDTRIGYIPQQRPFTRDVPLRGRDLVHLGLDGHRWGIPSMRRSARVDELINLVGADGWADAPIGQLSGGEQQRLRVAHALAGDPDLLLCDEPLLSLDIPGQHRVVDLLSQSAQRNGTAVLFVTHEINPVLPATDRVLYFARGSFRLGSPAEVMTSASLSELYQSPVDVISHRGALIILGGEHVAEAHPHHHEAESI